MSVGRRIVGEGPADARIMVIGEFPGREEAKTGRPFSPRRHRENEIDRFFDGIRLPDRGQVYFTYLVKEWCGDEAEYVAADYVRDEPELIAEIQRIQPTVIVALGRPVVQWFLGDVDLEETHALQWYLPIDSPRRVLFDVPAQVVIHAGYNPAAGFRSPELSSAVAYDFVQLEAFLNGDIAAKILYDDPIPNPVYEDLQDLDTLDAVMAAGGTISSDTEGWAHDPWSVQITTRIGHAYVLRYRNKALIDRFVEWVNFAPDLYTFIFHNSLHDLSVFRALGIDVRKITFHDTMIMAYNLQLEPQGLKPLCVRHANMAMQSYDDVMGDADTRIAIDWLLQVQENEDHDHARRQQEEFIRLTTTAYTDKKGKLKLGRKLRALPKLSKTDLHKSIERCLRSSRPRKLWEDQVIDRHVEAQRAYGSIWVATLDHVPLDRAIRYAGRDSDGTHRIFPTLAERLHAADMWEVYEADLGTVPLIDRMQYIGIKPDLAHFARLSDDLALELVDIQSRLARQLLTFGVEEQAAWLFNANSTYQVGDILYGKFALPELKQTRGGDPSTNDKILEALEKDPRIDPPVRTFIATIREFREVYKLKNTFVDQIPYFVNRWPFDGRIHATFRITRVVSGRLAASDPNLLALPKHGKFAKRFRQGFTAGVGHVIGSWDLSQIELRVLAHLSQDDVLLDAFRTGKDLHANLAQRIFGVAPKDQDGSKHRLPAKSINFGIPMGMTEIGLCVELKKNGVDVNEDDAKRWLTETMALYKSVPTYQQNKIAEARRQGFVTDLKGRRRYVGGIRSSDNATRSEAERFAFSTPIQAGAQEVMKVAEKWAWDNVFMPYQDAGFFVEPLIQIHDDLVPEFEQHLTDELDQKMVYAMTQTFKGLSVPIETSGDFGLNWGSQVPIRCGACKGFNREMRPEHKKTKASSCQHCGEEMKG